MEQLSFSWECHKTRGDGKTAVACIAKGADPDEYARHMRGEHGLKSITAPKPIRLRKTAPAATLRKVEIPLLKWIYWTEEHVQPGECRFCHHSSVDHRDGGMTKPGCNECDCQLTQWAIPPVRTTAERRGQFWSEGPHPHTFWVLPFEAAPWEHGRAKAVSVHVRQIHGRPSDVAKRQAA